MSPAAASLPLQARQWVTFDAHPDRYRHWKLSFDGAVATLAMDVDEEGGLKPGYQLKLNSYDLGVDIELHDALQRLRFEHPEVRSVVLTSAKERIFCSGANIFMLGLASHAWKVNFCKFTNETRNGIEDSIRHSGLKFLAACNGTTARRRALELAELSDRPREAQGIALTPIARQIESQGYRYSHVEVEIDAKARTATLTICAPKAEQPCDLASILAMGDKWWPLAMARELDDAILMLRTNDLEVGTWILKTRGDIARVLAADATLSAHASNWFVRETLGMLRRTLARLEVSSRTLFAV